MVDVVKVMLGGRDFSQEGQHCLQQLVEADSELRRAVFADVGKLGTFVDMAWERHVSNCQPFLQKSIAQSPKKFKELRLLKLCTKDVEKFVKLLRDFAVGSKLHEFVPTLSPTEMPTAKKLSS